MAKARKIEIEGNPFDALAGITPPKSSTSDKVVAKVTDQIKALVDKVLAHKKEIARLEAEQKEFEETIINHVRPQQDDDAYAQRYSNSYLVNGVEKSLLYVTSDKFSVDQDEATHAALKQLLGSNYDQIFKKKRTITLVEGVDQNQELIGSLVKAVTAAGLKLGDVFNVTDKILPEKDLAEKQYSYVSKADLPQWRSLCRQAKPALKSTGGKK